VLRCSPVSGSTAAAVPMLVARLRCPLVVGAPRHEAPDDGSDFVAREEWAPILGFLTHMSTYTERLPAPSALDRSPGPAIHDPRPVRDRSNPHLTGTHQPADDRPQSRDVDHQGWPATESQNRPCQGSPTSGNEVGTSSLPCRARPRRRNPTATTAKRRTCRPHATQTGRRLPRHRRQRCDPDLAPQPSPVI
jgi:hypothetical protein